MSKYRDKINSQKQGGVYKVADFRNGDAGTTVEFTHTIAFLIEDVEMFEREVDVLHFEDSNRQLMVNATNADILMDLFGDEPDEWPGNKITLYLWPYGKEGKLGIRVRAADTSTPEAAGSPTKPSSNGPPAVKPSRKGELDDEMPF